ncbi:MAG TPA: extracellular solute-binding protein, partial [Chloroflexota bacterium]
MKSIHRRLTRRGLISVSTLFAASALAACAAPAAPTPSAPAKGAAEVPATEAPKPAAPTTAAPAATKPAAVAPAPAAKEAVTIRATYRIGDKPEMYERLFPQFMQQNPTIKLVGEPISFGAYEEYFAKLASMMAADTLGDVVWVSAGSGPFLSQVFKGFFMPVDDLVKKASYDLKVWYPSALAALTWDGKLYALPSDMHPGAQFVFYNKKLLDAAGAKYPAAEWSYDDLIATTGKTTKRSGDRTEVFGFAPTTSSWAQEIIARSHGGSYLTPDGKKSAVKDEPARTALEWLYDGMHKQKVI